MKNVTLSPVMTRTLAVIFLLALHFTGFWYSWSFLNQQATDLRTQKESYASSWKSLFRKYGKPEVDFFREKDKIKDALVDLFNSDPSNKAMAEGKQLGNGWAAQLANQNARIDAENPFYITVVYTFSSASNASWRLADDSAQSAVFVPGFLETLIISGVGLWWALSSRNRAGKNNIDGAVATDSAK